MSISDDRENPFAPPKAAVLEAAPAAGDLVIDGRKLPAGRGTAWFSEAWTIFKMAPGTWILMGVVFIVIMLLFAVVPLGGLVTSVCYPVVAAGIMLGCRDLEEIRVLRVSYLFKGFSKNVGNLMLVGVLYLVGTMAVGFIVGVGMAIMMPFMFGSGGIPTGGVAWFMALAPIFLLALLVAAALMMPLIMAVWFAPALVVFHDLQPGAAMRASFRACLRNFVPFLIYGLVGLVIGIVALIPFGLGLLVTIPLVWITMYTGYRDIFLDR